MQAPFHWLRIETFIYATEKEDLVTETFRNIAGTDEFRTDVSEGEHGNQMLILQAMMSHKKEQENVFSRLGEELAREFYDHAEDKIDDDCVFYVRLDKQKAVCGEYSIAHHGDVISITGKVASNPARQEVAVRNMRAFLSSLFPSLPQSEQADRS